MSKLACIVPVAATFLLASAMSSPTTTTVPAPRPTPPDTSQLRQALAAALGGDFRIVRHELSPGTPERTGPFWLVFAQPTRSGDFALSYRYQYVDQARPERPLYTHVVHDSYIRVGERGCWRRRQARDICMGDTIILPFVIGPHYGHLFTVTYRGPDTGRLLSEDSRGLSPGVDSIANPAAPQLRLVGWGTSVQQHRRPGATMVHNATFEAGAPGRFNLALSPRIEGVPTSAVATSGGTPVIVVPRGQPVTVLLEREQVTGIDSINNFRSNSGNQYLTSHLLLQPGDRISFEFGRLVQNGRDPGGHVPRPAPVIARAPFALDVGRGFDAWVIDHLPPPARR
jgi:hypothetical protein